MLLYSDYDPTINSDTATLPLHKPVPTIKHTFFSKCVLVQIICNTTKAVVYRGDSGDNEDAQIKFYNQQVGLTRKTKPKVQQKKYIKKYKLSLTETELEQVTNYDYNVLTQSVNWGQTNANNNNGETSIISSSSTKNTS